MVGWMDNWVVKLLVGGWLGWISGWIGKLVVMPVGEWMVG